MRTHSRRNINTPYKQITLQTVKDNPGHNTHYLAKASGIPVWAVAKILPELAAAGLIYSELENPNNNRKRWYPGKKLLVRKAAVANKDGEG